MGVMEAVNMLKFDGRFGMTRTWEQGCGVGRNFMLLESQSESYKRVRSNVLSFNAWRDRVNRMSKGE